MAAFGIKAIQPQDNEHILGFATARATAGDSLLEIWNGPTSADLVYKLDKDGVATHGGDVLSDTDSTDSLGSTGTRWLKLWVDDITLGGVISIAGGTAGAPGLAFTGDLDTGFSSPGANIFWFNAGGTTVLTATASTIHVVANLQIDDALNHDGTTVGFYGTVPTTLLTGVAVSAAGIHAALVTLGLITA